MRHDVTAKNGLHPCTKGRCWVPSFLEKEWTAIWPLRVEPENDRDSFGNKFFKWNLYVNWSKNRGSRVSDVWLCEKHHKFMLHMMESEMEKDVSEQEATDQWMIRNRGKL